MLNVFKKSSNTVSSETFAPYEKAATDWEHDKWKGLIRSRTIAWGIAGLTTVIAVAEGLAIYSLAPMKEKIPYLLRVDNSTGIVDEMVTVYDNQEMQADEGIIRYFIKKYIDARESYEYAFANKDYKIAYLMSEKELSENFKLSYIENNPVKLYGKDTRLKVKIKTFELLEDKTAIVRILSEQLTPDEPTVTNHYLIRLSYEFLNGQIPQSVRDITPLGFVITSYSITRENYQ